MVLGEDILEWILLALGGALVVGNVLALVRPPERPGKGEMARAPVGRSLVMIGIGAVAAVWAVASLISKA